MDFVTDLYTYYPESLSDFWKGAVIAVMVFVGAAAWRMHSMKLVSKGRAVALTLFITYLFSVYAATVFSRPLHAGYSYELLPFWSYRAIREGEKSLIKENFYNVLMLMPVGFLLPAGGVFEFAMRCGHKRSAQSAGYGKRNAFYTILAGFLVSLSIELMQLIFKRGLFEFDDMLHNTIGTAVGYGIYQGIRYLRYGRIVTET